MAKSAVITDVSVFSLPKITAFASALQFPNQLIQHPKRKEFKSAFEYDEVELLREDVRLGSFFLWPGWSYRHPEDLAATGMYFTGQKDTVKCIECSLEVSGWKASQVPKQVHEEKSPYCPMITKSGSRNIPSSGKGLEMKIKGKHKTRVKLGAASLNESDAVTRKGSQDIMAGRDIHANDMGAGVSSRTRGDQNCVRTVPDMKIISNRLKSFEGKWLENFPVKPNALANAGFYFKGPHDRVVCAFCDGKVYNWIQGDSPVGEHTRLFPNCSFVQELNKTPLDKLHTHEAKALKLMGYSEPVIQKAFNECELEGVLSPCISQLMEIILAQEEAEEETQNKMSSSSQFSSTRSTKGTKDSAELSEVFEIQRENESLKASNTCKVCLTSEVHCVFLPCGHLVCCMNCADKVENCPLCRTKILGSVKAYRA